MKGLKFPHLFIKESCHELKLLGNVCPKVCLLTCRAMDQEQSVNAIVEYVSSLEACPHIQELKAAMDEVKKESIRPLRLPQ